MSTKNSTGKDDFIMTTSGPVATVGQSAQYAEIDPHGKTTKDPGAKLDAGKAQPIRGCFQYFPRAVLAVSGVSVKGAEKYAWNGWESVPDGLNRYTEALGRHLALEVTEGLYDTRGGTGCLHAAQVAWNAFARLELLLREIEDADLDHMRSEDEVTYG